MHQLICSVAMVVALLAGALAAHGQQLDSNGLPRQTAAPAPAIPWRPAQILSTGFDSVRTLREINRSGEADAYPWLSADGLRLYYTYDVGGTNQTAMASRTQRQQPFSSPQLVAGLPSDYFSAWLTADELTCLLVDRPTRRLWRTTRPTLTAAFATPTLVPLNGTAIGMVLGPSLSPDGSELMLTIYNQGYRQARFRSAPNGAFAFSGYVSLPFEPGPGQFFDQGLGYIGSNYDSLYILRRPSLLDTFALPIMVSLNRSALINRQPTFQTSIDAMVFMGASQNTWSEDELWLAERSHGVMSVRPAFDNPRFTLTPNPAHHTVRLTGLPPTATTAQVIDALGRTVRTASLEPATSNLSLAGLSPGLYTVRVGAATRRLVVE